MEISVKQIIDTADRRMPGNEYTLAEKVEWVKALRKKWLDFEKEAGTTEAKLSDAEEKLDSMYGYNKEDAELYYNVRVFPQDNWEMYVLWLVMKMHYYNGEIELYNNSALAFSDMFEAAKKECIRQNRSVRNVKFTGHREV